MGRSLGNTLAWPGELSVHYLNVIIVCASILERHLRYTGSVQIHPRWYTGTVNRNVIVHVLSSQPFDNVVLPTHFISHYFLNLRSFRWSSLLPSSFVNRADLRTFQLTALNFLDVNYFLQICLMTTIS